MASPLRFTPRPPHPYRFPCKCLSCKREHQHTVAVWARYIRKLRKKAKH